ncbi:MAG TPA: SRPBCC family protein, partial [Thermomicrobiales bacterium]|nr:SRPBCC family protein [Thermomicrobiales bacterium]
DDVFAFVADISRLPDYVPSVRSATALPDGRVRVQGRIGQTDYTDHGLLTIDPEKRRLEWRADDRNYHGSLTVSDEITHSRVWVRLSFGIEKIDAANPSVPDEAVRRSEPTLGPGAHDPISTSLEAALDSLHDLLQGQGGKRNVTAWRQEHGAAQPPGAS